MHDPFQLVGSTLEGPVLVQDVVGKGGFGVVYRGEHKSFGEPVAIKVLKLPTTLAGKEREVFLNKFQLEARILYKLSQTTLNVVRPIHFGSTQTAAGFAPYCVMEWLEGQTLDQAQRERRERIEAGALAAGRSVAEITPTLEPLVAALEAAHSLGVVHRDIKPPNVFLLSSQQPNVKLLDFGIAKLIDLGGEVGGDTTLSSGTLMALTPEYAAPEQWDRSLGDIGAHTDVYALALMTVELLADRHPHRDMSASQRMFAACDLQRRPTPRTLGLSSNDEVEAVFAAALAVEPSQRTRSARVFWQALVQAAARSMSAAPFAPTAAAIAPTLLQQGQQGHQVSHPGLVPTPPQQQQQPGPHAAPTRAQAQGHAQYSGPHAAPTQAQAQDHAQYSGPHVAPTQAQAQSHAQYSGPHAAPAPPRSPTSDGWHAASAAGGGTTQVTGAGANRWKAISIVAIVLAVIGIVAAVLALTLGPPSRGGSGAASDGSGRASGSGSGAAHAGGGSGSGSAARPPGPCDKFPSTHACAVAVDGLYRRGKTAQSLAMARHGCKLRDALGCNTLAVHYYSAAGVALDYKRARELFAQGCARDEPWACSNLAAAYEIGLGGVARDAARARQLYAKARRLAGVRCQKGVTIDCRALAMLMANKRGGPRDAPGGLLVYRKACDRGDLVSCVGEADLLAGGRFAVRKNLRRARERYRKACDAGEPMGCNGLGWLYYGGSGVPRNYARARQLFERACGKTVRHGCVAIGWLFRNGHGVRRDYKKANAYYRKACNKTQVSGCANLGYMVREGLGVKRDRAEARALFERSCRWGDGNGCVHLGYLHQKGLGVRRDRRAARRLYREACRRGWKSGCKLLRKMNRRDQLNQLRWR